MDTNGDGLGDTLLPYTSNGGILECGDYHPLVHTTSGIGLEKWVKYKDESDSEYRKAIENATICSNVTFKIVIENKGASIELTNVEVTDVLNCSLRYINGSAIPDTIYANNCPNNQTLNWTFSILEPQEYINITFDARIVECGNDTNYAHVVAENEASYTVVDNDTAWVNCTPPRIPVETATGTGTAYFATDAGTIEDLVAINESTLPAEGKPPLAFPHGFFSFNITGLTQGQTVVVTITLPDNVPVGTEYWKYHASEGGWIQIPMGSDDGDNVITITLVDGGLGDDDGTANGLIVDQGGPGIPGAPPVITSFAPPSPVNDTVCNWRTFNVTVNQTVNVSWYLNGSFLFTNASVREASCMRHAAVAGEHNVSAVATNANGTDMQTWVWNVTAAPLLNCTCGDICVNTTGWWRDGGAFNASNTPIQHAIDNATAGETVCVKDGTYNENVNVNKRLTIKSENGSASTVVQAASSNDHVFEITADYVNISGFNVTGATGDNKTGIYLGYADHCNVSGNTAPGNWAGIGLVVSSNNNITSNTASKNTEYGIGLSLSDYNSISDNTASNNTVGIGLDHSNYNNISGNTASKNTEYGIGLEDSIYNAITSNTVSVNADCGIALYSSGYNIITNNAASNNEYGIGLSSSDYNNISDNTATNNDCGIGLKEQSLYNNIMSNTASANNEYGIGLSVSGYNNISDNTASNNWAGIGLSLSGYNNISGNTASNNYYGIGLEHSRYNNISGNTANSNNGLGVYLYDSSNNNLIYNNYFENTHNANDNGNNAWNITKTAGTNIIGGPYLGGNYWSDYAGVDNDGDGLGNTLRPYNSSGSITTGGDWHPLVQVGFAPPNITSFAPPSPVNDTVCTWRTFNVTVNQTVNVSWYLNNTLQHTNESTKEANYTLHAEVVGEHNVTAIASNANGTDMQTWLWNVTKAVDLVITGKWLCWPENCTICYNVTNIGNGTAHACHSTALYVDGVAVAYDHVPEDLAPGESYIGCFADYSWTYTSPSDNITVCADNNETVDELDEDNNCLTNIWSCGEVEFNAEEGHSCR